MKAAALRACAFICLLFGGLQVLCTAMDVAGGVGLVQGVLGFLWAVACIVCGLVTVAASIPPATKSGAAPAEGEA